MGWPQLDSLSLALTLLPLRSCGGRISVMDKFLRSFCSRRVSSSEIENGPSGSTTARKVPSMWTGTNKGHSLCLGLIALRVKQFHPGVRHYDACRNDLRNHGRWLEVPQKLKSTGAFVRSLGALPVWRCNGHLWLLVSPCPIVTGASGSLGDYQDLESNRTSLRLMPMIISSSSRGCSLFLSKRAHGSSCQCVNRVLLCKPQIM